MRNSVFISTIAAASLIGAGAAWAQNRDNAASGQPAATQSAPAESPHASGHDAQTGQPETADRATKQGKEKTMHKSGKSESKKGDRQ